MKHHVEKHMDDGMEKHMKERHRKKGKPHHQEKMAIRTHHGVHHKHQAK